MWGFVEYGACHGFAMDLSHCLDVEMMGGAFTINLLRDHGGFLIRVSGAVFSVRFSCRRKYVAPCI